MNLLRNLFIPGTVLALALFVPSEAYPQGSQVFFLRGTDGGGGVDTLRFGRDPRGTYCVDGGVNFLDYCSGRTLVEFELPPIPPTGVFDFRFGNNRSGMGGCSALNERGNGMRNDIRGSSGRTRIDTFQVRFQIGSSGPISFSWPSGLNTFCDSMRLRDPFGGIIANLDMLSNQSYTVTSGSLTNMNIIMYGVTDLSVLSPANGDTVSLNPTLFWNGRPGATHYRLQVATDSMFTAGSVFIHDSSVAGTSRSVGSLTSMTTYYWRVAAGNCYGWTAFSPTRRFIASSAVAVEEDDHTTFPVKFALHQNFPNPFNPSTTIRFDLPRDTRITIEIYNVLGQRVRSIVDDYLEAGVHTMSFDASSLAGGVYFYKMDARSSDGSQRFGDVKKLVLLK